jgi:enterochelin esterase family protein
MVKTPTGRWAVTLGPFEPNLYEYRFNLDGVVIPDTGNAMPKPQRHVNTSLLLIPGDPPDFLDSQTGAHGTICDETYYSTVLGKNREVLVYTPPAYDRSRAPLPVLYLYHGFWDTRYSWVTEGRLAQILDNLLAQGKAAPMIVVVPEAHALPPEPTPATTGNGLIDVQPYLVRNQRAVDEELFHDLIPFVQAHYNVSAEPRERAIAGLSMGGLQAIETGIVHLGYFDWIGAFSPGVLPHAFSDDFQNALKDAEKINGTLRLFDIVVGDKDPLVAGPNAEFDAELTRLNVRHGYTVVPGTHSMFVWRPALAHFLQQIFTR